MKHFVVMSFWSWFQTQPLRFLKQIIWLDLRLADTDRRTSHMEGGTERLGRHVFLPACSARRMIRIDTTPPPSPSFTNYPSKLVETVEEYVCLLQINWSVGVIGPTVSTEPHALSLPSLTVVRFSVRVGGLSHCYFLKVGPENPQILHWTAYEIKRCFVCIFVVVECLNGIDVSAQNTTNSLLWSTNHCSTHRSTTNADTNKWVVFTRPKS